MFSDKFRIVPVAVALLGAVLLAGCSPGRRGAATEGGADGFHDAAWGGAEDCADWHFAAPRWTPSWPIAWSGEAPLPARAMAALAGERGAQEGGADGFTQTGLLPQAPGCALPAAAWLPHWGPALVPGALAWTPLRLVAPGEAAPEEADPAAQGEDARLLPGDLAAHGRSFGHGRHPGAALGADLSGPYLLLWPGSAAAGGQGGGAGAGSGGGGTGSPGGGAAGPPAGEDQDEGAPVDTFAVDTTTPVLAPVISGSTIPEPATMALLGVALIGLGLFRGWD